MLPPGAHRIVAALLRRERLPGMVGGRCSLIVNVGLEAWEGRRGPFPTVVLPPDMAAGVFDWRFAANHEPLLVRCCGDCPKGRVGELAVAAFRDGVGRLLELDTARLWVSQ